MTYGTAMGNIWILYGLLLSISNPYMLLSSDDLHSIVFYYGISTYFALPHTFPIASTMGMVWLSSIPKPRPTTMGLLRISHHPLAFPYHPSILLPLWDCYGLQNTIPFPYHPSLLLLIWDIYGPQSTIPFPYHPGILQLIWDCYGLKTTIPFPYYLSILQVMWKYCYRPRSTISLPYHPEILVSDIGMI